MGMAPFSAVPPELGARYLTLQYTLGPNSPPSFPTGILPPQQWKEGPWDPDVLALKFLPEFVRTDWDKIKLHQLIQGTADAHLLDWDLGRGKTQAENFVEAEVEYLQELMQNDRERYLPEILIQHDNAPAYWGALLALDHSTYPKTFQVLNLAVRIGQIVAAYYKWKYKRPRPSYVCPGLLPPYGPPAHTSFPSGHALQSWLLTGLLTKVAPKFKEELKWLAERVATNRERAGLHYRSDSRAGEIIAEQCVRLIDHYCPDISCLITQAHDEEWKDKPIPNTPIV